MLKVTQEHNKCYKSCVAHASSAFIDNKTKTEWIFTGENEK